MAIDISQIHNLVRTYQRALQDSTELRRGAAHSSAASQGDRVSLSAEARERGERSEAAAPHKGRKA